jgi:hypothetical protein
MFIVAKHVDIIVTDSPIILGCAYTGGDKLLNEILVREHAKYENIDIFLDRVKPYNPKGRMQTEDEAKVIDMDMRQILKDLGVSYVTYPGLGPQNAKEIASYISAEIERRRTHEDK